MDLLHIIHDCACICKSSETDCIKSMKDKIGITRQVMMHHVITISKLGIFIYSCCYLMEVHSN